MKVTNDSLYEQCKKKAKELGTSMEEIHSKLRNEESECEFNRRVKQKR